MRFAKTSSKLACAVVSLYIILRRVITGVLHENPMLNNSVNMENDKNDIKLSPVKLRSKTKRTAEVSLKFFFVS